MVMRSGCASLTKRRATATAIFTDDNPNGFIGEYGATFEWGDGLTSQTADTDFASNPSGLGFVITAVHDYGQPAKGSTYLVVITLAEKDNAFDSVRMSLMVTF